MNSFVSVYCDWAVTEEAALAATATLPFPAGVEQVTVTCGGDTLGCRVAVDLIGTFDEKTEGRGIARRYASQLSEALGMPAFALYDLIIAGRSDW